MTPHERDLIQGLMDRLRAYGTIDKDRDAETLINTQVREIPDSAYLLVQSVIVQDQALSGANDRIRQLESRVRELEQARGSTQPSSGGFLGGLFGGSSHPAPTSVPTTRASTSMPQNSPWGQSASQPAAAAPVATVQPQYAQPAAAPQRAGGGFLASAMSTAAGVAGGMFAADALRGLFGGGHQGGFGSPMSGQTGYSQADVDRAQDEAQDEQAALDAQQQEDARQDVAQDDNDPGTDMASDDSGSWGGDGGTDV